MNKTEINRKNSGTLIDGTSEKGNVVVYYFILDMNLETMVRICNLGYNQVPVVEPHRFWRN